MATTAPPPAPVNHASLFLPFMHFPPILTLGLAMGHALANGTSANMMQAKVWKAFGFGAGLASFCAVNLEATM